MSCDRPQGRSRLAVDMESFVLIIGANKGACGEDKDEVGPCIVVFHYVSGICKCMCEGWQRVSDNYWWVCVVVLY
jgi:hypothetical protein